MHTGTHYYSNPGLYSPTRDTLLGYKDEEEEAVRYEHDAPNFELMQCNAPNCQWYYVSWSSIPNSSIDTNTKDEHSVALHL